MLRRSSRLAPIARRALPAAVRLPARAVAGSAAGNQQATADSGKFDALDKRRRQLLYRSKQRGWLEMDIMLGGWARRPCPGRRRLPDVPPHPPHSTPALTQFAEIIEMENPDLYCWLTGQQDVPDDISNPLLRTLCAELKESYAPKATLRSTGSFEGKVWE
ncbi:hypothetical protein EMIHUDRAFT_434617 [Emiliania huxleyi CCMP1516]|uniref:Succinate dehydrogenase assembly factor 2, mitochondrial n=2 Tax=Emiliania huxleyi TaxID=2903 RepID=A0A0D3K0D3_EMIH1|nr:hypothetical protein EMIHUDRAFT_434617 [Emiliania huxleyi CCMP1516]EOD29218.1 hypothetical protein EMIHUDRAFT_434617 [Emiliania huxleyi CCMP1516]|eukprot:XP_005781647.1 hypothetical protein EMIHUDRAFT_434617 [Emiliania huxleyi CCMP1516]